MYVQQTKPNERRTGLMWRIYRKSSNRDTMGQQSCCHILLFLRGSSPTPVAHHCYLVSSNCPLNVSILLQRASIVCRVALTRVPLLSQSAAPVQPQGALCTAEIK